MTIPTVVDVHASLPQSDDTHPTETPAPTMAPLDRLPDSIMLAGQPLRHLLSDLSGPGAVLRDRLMIHP